jgi:cell division transport system permease protein
MKKTPSYLYSIIGISLVLFLLGTIGWLVLNGRSLSKFFKEQVELQVILHDETRPENTAKLEAILKKQPFVKEAKVITKEEAAAEFQKEWDEDFTELLDFNPLYSSINVRLYPEYVNADSLAKIKAFLLQSNIVREVSYPTVVVDKMNSNFKKIGLVLGAIALVLLIAVIIIIDNTVRLAMFSNRRLIKTMQMVGATQWFIAKPFDRRAFTSGLISGVIAIGGLFIVKYLADTQMPELKALRDPFALAFLMAGIVVLGILISLISTHRSVIKYLKYKLDNLY